LKLDFEQLLVVADDDLDYGDDQDEGGEQTLVGIVVLREHDSQCRIKRHKSSNGG
jgi:predicted hydrolase (HD superfamily)